MIDAGARQEEDASCWVLNVTAQVSAGCVETTWLLVDIEQEGNVTTVSVD